MNASGDPVFQYYHGIILIMEVAKNAKVRGLPGISGTKLIERFGLSLEFISAVFAAVAVAPVGAETECDPWVKLVEKNLAYPAVEDAQHKAISQFSAAKGVSVSKQKGFSVDVRHLRLL